MPLQNQNDNNKKIASSLPSLSLSIQNQNKRNKEQNNMFSPREYLSFLEDKKDNKIIFNEFSEDDYGSLDLLDLNEKYAIFDKTNEKILSDIEWAIDKLTLEDLIISDDETP